MKRNLLRGIVLISAVALSSCSTTNKLAGTPDVDNDDVYYTKAKAGDEIIYADAGYQQNNNPNNYNDYDDDYYYYGDYSSRINRFNYYSPFDYGDNFYYGYSPYNRFNFSLGLGFNSPYWGGYSSFGYGSPYSSFYYGSLYSPFYGYSPFYDLYGFGGGWGGYGWGGPYSSYMYGGYGGYGGRGFVRQNPRPAYAGGSAVMPGRMRPGNYGPAPGRRPYGTGNQPGNSIYNNATRGVRPVRDTRPAIQQVAPTPSPSNSGGGGGSSGGGGGGGGRPVRP